VADEPIDLIFMEGEGNSVILRVAGDQDNEVLTGELLIKSSFVSGSLAWFLFPDDLREWQEALDELDAGYDVAWREGGRGPEMFVERDPNHERLNVTIKDDAGSMTAVTISVPVADSWFDDAYRRLELVWKAWPRTSEG
jgi:uncharacterized protein DUF5959